MDLTAEIRKQRNAIERSNIDPDRKAELLGRLDRLAPESKHPDHCDCGYCESGFAGSDEKAIDPAVIEMNNNFSNPIIPPKIMNSKAFPFIVIGVGLVLTFIGIKMMRKKASAE